MPSLCVLVTASSAYAADSWPLQVDAPSWGYMVSAGMPGTIWEAWGGDAHSSDGELSRRHVCFLLEVGTKVGTKEQQFFISSSLL
jgi:hypothetical protein